MAAHINDDPTDAVPVTADNFIRAESDAVFTGLVAQGGFGKFYHNRELTPIDSHIVQRPNRDTLYSTGVFDLDAGPVTITLPDAGKRFMTMIVIDEDHYVFTVVYGAGRHTLTKEKIGTRYAVAAIRILVDPNDPKDVAQVNALQDAVKVEQPGGPGKFEVPNWDAASQKKVRDALVVLGETIPDWRRAAGRRDEVDPVRHLIVTATGWGLNPDKDAIYLNVTPSKNDGTTIYKLNVKDVPVDGFWSISLYNAEGYFEQERSQRLFAQQHHGEEERRRLGRHPVRRLRRQDPELPADHAGLELHGAALSPARRDPERHLDIPRSRADRLAQARGCLQPNLRYARKAALPC